MSKQKNNQKQCCIYLNCNEIIFIFLLPQKSIYTLIHYNHQLLSYTPTFEPFLGFSTLAKLPDKQIYDLRLLILC